MSTVTKVYSNIRGLQAAIKDVGRLRQILLVLAKHGFGAVVTKLGLHETVGIKNLMAYTDGDAIPYSAAQRLRMAIEDLGPTFIKLGQTLSTRPDLIPAEVVLELEALQDSVPPMPWPDVEEQIRGSLGGPIDSFFAAFEHEPLASASVAQVHLAALPSGEDVVVKVRRKGIAGIVDSDLSILQFMARRAEGLVPELELVDPVGMVGEFERAIRRELDFTNERRHIERFRRSFEDSDTVHIPATHDALCKTDLLTMELIKGVKVTQAPAELGVDPYVLAPTLMHSMFKMVLQDGLFHGDLHPGNILVEESGRIALIDFGLVGRLTRQQRENILDLLIGVSREDYQLVSRVIFDIGIKVRGVRYDYGAFEADVVDVIERRVADRSLSEVDVQATFAELVAGAIRHQIKMPPTYTMVFKALMTAEGIGKTLVPNMNFIEEAKPLVRDLLFERYSPGRLMGEGAELLGTASRFLRQLPARATGLLREAEQGNLTIRVKIEDLERLAAGRRRDARLFAGASVFAASAVAGSLALDSPVGQRIMGMSAVSVVFFALSALVGLPLLWSLLRQR